MKFLLKTSTYVHFKSRALSSLLKMASFLYLYLSFPPTEANKSIGFGVIHLGLVMQLLPLLQPLCWWHTSVYCSLRMIVKYNRMQAAWSLHTIVFRLHASVFLQKVRSYFTPRMNEWMNQSIYTHLRVSAFHPSWVGKLHNVDLQLSTVI